MNLTSKFTQSGEGTQLESDEGKSTGQRKSTRELRLGLDPAGLSAASAMAERAPPPRGERKDLEREKTSINPLKNNFPPNMVTDTSYIHNRKIN